MRILVLGKYYPPYRGGIETLTRDWCEGFVGRGGTVTCVVAHDRPRTVVEHCQGVRLERCARYGTVLSTALCPRYLAAARRPADLIQLHFPNPLADLAMVLGRRHVPLVVTYHSDIVRQAAFLRLYRPLLNWLLRRADRIVVATPPQLAQATALRPYLSKCLIVPFGVDPARFAAPAAVSDRVRQARAEAGSRTVLLNVGRLVPYKGQRYLIEALRSLDAVVWLVGSGPLRAELSALAESLGVADRVRFWGEVEDAELPAFLQMCDLFVLPSITPNEAFGIVQLEAMACGRPVVSCQLPSGVPYVNQDGVTGLVVPPADSRALAAALGRLAADPGLCTRLGEGGGRRLRDEFSLDRMVERYWNLFRQLTEAPRAA